MRYRIVSTRNTLMMHIDVIKNMYLTYLDNFEESDLYTSRMEKMLVKITQIARTITNNVPNKFMINAPPIYVYHNDAIIN